MRNDLVRFTFEGRWENVTFIDSRGSNWGSRYVNNGNGKVDWSGLNQENILAISIKVSWEQRTCYVYLAPCTSSYRLLPSAVLLEFGGMMDGNIELSYSKRVQDLFGGRPVHPKFFCSFSISIFLNESANDNG